MNPFSPARYQRTRPLRYEGKTRFDPLERINLHRSLRLPYYVEVTDLYVGVRSGARQFYRRAAAVSFVGMLMFGGGAGVAYTAGWINGTGFLPIAVVLLVKLLAGLWAMAESGRETEECVTYLKEQDRFLSCFWPDEPSQAMVESLYLRRRQHIGTEAVRWIAELTLKLREPARGELFIASGESMQQMLPIAATLADQCGVPLYLDG